MVSKMMSVSNNSSSFLELITSPNESSEMAFSVENSNGILFCPVTELQVG